MTDIIFIELLADVGLGHIEREGLDPDEVWQREQELGIKFPELLHQFMLELGEWSIHAKQGDRLRRLKHIDIEDGVLYFFNENQVVCRFGCAIAELSDEDPEVISRSGRSDGTVDISRLGIRLSDFLQFQALHSSIDEFDHFGSNEIHEPELSTIEKIFLEHGREWLAMPANTYFPGGVRAYAGISWLMLVLGLGKYGQVSIGCSDQEAAVELEGLAQSWIGIKEQRKPEPIGPDQLKARQDFFVAMLKKAGSPGEKAQRKELFNRAFRPPKKG